MTSTAAGEGKSTVAVNLALLLADDGRKVLLIDGDLRRQTDAARLGIGGKHSLQDVAAGGKRASELVGKIRSSGLYFLGNSSTMEQPVPVLTSGAVQRFVEEMREKMDFVIIDTPPCEMFPGCGAAGGVRGRHALRGEVRRGAPEADPGRHRLPERAAGRLLPATPSTAVRNTAGSTATGGTGTAMDTGTDTGPGAAAAEKAGRKERAYDRSACPYRAGCGRRAGHDAGVP